MEVKTDISIVIPVYNLEKYIRTCVESIYPITNTEIEVLLVDDGSSDGSPGICDELAREYKEVRVIHKSNGGAADSRNTGILAAASEYIMFMDGDDFLEKGAVDTIWKRLESKPEILTFDYYEYYGSEDVIPMRHLNTDSFTDADGNISEELFKTASPLPMPWLYAVSSAYIRKNQIYMHKGLLDEDEEWTARLFAHAAKVENLHENLYYYRRNRENSLTFHRAIQNTLADIEIIRILQEEKESGKYTSSGQAVLDNKRRQMVNKVLDDLPGYSGKDKRHVKEAIKPYRSLLCSGTTMDKLYYYLAPLIGRKNIRAFVRMLVEWKGRKNVFGG